MFRIELLGLAWSSGPILNGTGVSKRPAESSLGERNVASRSLQGRVPSVAFLSGLSGMISAGLTRRLSGNLADLRVEDVEEILSLYDQAGDFDNGDLKQLISHVSSPVIAEMLHTGYHNRVPVSHIYYVLLKMVLEPILGVPIEIPPREECSTEKFQEWMKQNCSQYRFSGVPSGSSNDLRMLEILCCKKIARDKLLYQTQEILSQIRNHLTVTFERSFLTHI
ncbi:MAG: hypothetical protein A3F09_05075 [Chlamydiae bacterium RIFCSPHIGHO2_12_FULL_49_11]|nr:MAG: hypothetical protein A3F09_05075 [Chlamydiae bacterium RIFCSPHIGHO2_12_FULL_49_11]